MTPARKYVDDAADYDAASSAESIFRSSLTHIQHELRRIRQWKTMRFPTSDRVRYNKNPLVEVICQLRYSKILRLDKEPPYEVQEAIRADYPTLSISQGVEVAMPVAGNAQPIAISQGKSYDFLSADQKWKFVLTGDFIALSTTAYTTWEVFKSKIVQAIELIGVRYGITNFTRVGLRYRDVIIREELGLSNSRWSSLLRPEFTGILGVPDFQEQDVQEALSVLAFTLGAEDGYCRIRHGLARKADSKALGYLIDADFFNARLMEASHVGSTLDDFNGECGRLFRWCISATLHDAMEPQLINQ